MNNISRMISSFLLLSLLGSMNQAQTQLGAPATLTIRIVDTYGSPLKYKIASFHSSDQPEVELAEKFEGLNFRDAVQGKAYEFRAVPLPEAKDFPAFKQRVNVGEPFTLAVFAVPKNAILPDAMTPWPLTHFHITPSPKRDGLVWVIVRAAFLPEAYPAEAETAQVSEDGTFTLHGLHGGRYMVTVCRESSILGMAIVDIPLLGPPNPIEIHLR